MNSVTMQKTLLRAGYDVETAKNYVTGLEAFQNALEQGDPFDLALLDLSMPNREGRQASGAGLELLSELRALKGDLAAIVLTAYDEVGKAKDAISRGATAYFVKGREQGLVELIQKTLSE